MVRSSKLVVSSSNCDRVTVIEARPPLWMTKASTDSRPDSDCFVSSAVVIRSCAP